MFSRITDKLITITEEDYKIANEKFHCSVYHVHGVGVDEKRYFSVSYEEQLTLREELNFSSNQKLFSALVNCYPIKIK